MRSSSPLTLACWTASDTNSSICSRPRVMRSCTCSRRESVSIVALIGTSSVSGPHPCAVGEHTMNAAVVEGNSSAAAVSLYEISRRAKGNFTPDPLSYRQVERPFPPSPDSPADSKPRPSRLDFQIVESSGTNTARAANHRVASSRSADSEERREFRERRITPPATPRRDARLAVDLLRGQPPSSWSRVPVATSQEETAEHTSTSSADSSQQ